MSSGAMPHYQPCRLVCRLTIGHAFWCDTSSSTMPVGVVPHYRPCMLAWYLTIGHVFWSIATAINILLVERRWMKGGYKSGGNCTEVPLYQTCLMIWCHSQTCLLVQWNLYKTCMLGSWIHLRMFVNKVSGLLQIHQTCLQVGCRSHRVVNLSGTILNAILNIPYSEWCINSITGLLQG